MAVYLLILNRTQYMSFFSRWERGQVLDDGGAAFCKKSGGIAGYSLGIQAVHARLGRGVKTDWR
jgi:hypothetical protein